MGIFSLQIKIDIFMTKFIFLDINECDPAKSLHRCDQICQNTQGSYKCACETGFQLSRDGYDCEGNCHFPELT